MDKGADFSAPKYLWSSSITKQDLALHLSSHNYVDYYYVRSPPSISVSQFPVQVTE